MEDGGVWEIFEEHRDRYDEWFEKTPGREIFAIELEALRQEAKKFPHPWLEVGVGTGRFAQALGIEYGVDPSSKMLEMAKKRGITVYHASGEDLPFPDESFYLVFLIVTICFLENVSGVLREIRRVLKKDGGLIIGTILAGSPWAEFYQKKAAEEGNPFYRYAHFYSLEEIQHFLKQADFHLVRIISTLVQPPGLTRDVLEMPTWGVHPKSGFQVIVAQKTAG
ncbi:MAG: class I SAM-dependent methyltransferase [bacterium]